MRETPIFSLCHGTARVPGGWEEACERWRRACHRPERVEYVLSIHRRGRELGYSDLSFPDLYQETLMALRLWWPDSGVLAVNPGEPTMTNNGNMAAACSSGRVLVDVNDDLLPCDGWDTALFEAIERAGGLDSDFVIKVSHGDYHPELITHPVLSRSYYERIGPVDTAYLAYGADDEATVRAYRDGVVIDAPQIVFEHLDWRKGQRPKDAIDEWNNRPEVWKNRAETLDKRVPLRKTIAVCTPGTPFDALWLAEWDALFAWLLSRYEVKRAYALGNNIYQVRELAFEAVKSACPTVPDYVLWLDSDNPPKREAVEWLLASMEAAESAGPDEAVDIIGGCYRMDDERGVIAAGGMATLLSETDVRASRSLIEIENVIGFGCLLMRGSVMDTLGADAFAPKYIPGRARPLTDDMSWCHCAMEAGYKIWLHPMAWVEHLKITAVPARAGIQKEEVNEHGFNSHSGGKSSDV